jgi:hypothetical protein
MLSGGFMNEAKRKNIDLLIEDFWKRGYRIVSRKYGTYLPEPSKVGAFDIDIIARYKKNYAIGIVLNDNDIVSDSLMEKIKFLADRKTKYSNKRVLLFIGVSVENFKTIKTMISIFNNDLKKNIKVVAISEKNLQPFISNEVSQTAIFS